MSYVGHTIDRSLLDKAHYMMRPFILRRLKSEVEQTLPPKVETLVECPMSQLQRDISQFLLLQKEKIVKKMEGLIASSQTAAPPVPMRPQPEAEGSGETCGTRTETEPTEAVPPNSDWKEQAGMAFPYPIPCNAATPSCCITLIDKLSASNALPVNMSK